jgi:hypothetical protein
VRVLQEGPGGVTYRDRCLAGVAEEWKRKIDDGQPYHARKRAPFTELGWLLAINNAHKHRTLQTAHVRIETPVGFSVATSPNEVRGLTLRWRQGTRDFSLKAEMPPDEWMEGSSLEFDRKMQMDNRAGVEVTFGDVDQRLTVAQIKRVVEYTEALVEWFKPAFAPQVD